MDNITNCQGHKSQPRFSILLWWIGGSEFHKIAWIYLEVNIFLFFISLRVFHQKDLDVISTQYHIINESLVMFILLLFHVLLDQFRYVSEYYLIFLSPEPPPKPQMNSGFFCRRPVPASVASPRCQPNKDNNQPRQCVRRINLLRDSLILL